MKLLYLAALLWLPIAGAAELEPFTAHYDVSFSGLSGESVTTLARAGDATWVLESRTRARGIARLIRPRDAVEYSEFTMSGGAPRPLAFRSEDGSRQNKKGSTIDFDWAEGTATATYEDATRDIALSPGVLDRQLLQVALMGDLAAGATAIQYTVIDRHDRKTYEVAVVGRPSIAVPAGTFDTVLIERRRPGSSRSSLMWLAPELDYLTVRMQQLKDDKVIGTLELTEID